MSMPQKHVRCGGWLASAILGLDDGLVTTLVTIMAVSRAAAAHLLVVMLGVVLASAISMALGGFAGAKTERDIAKQTGDLGRAREIHPITQGIQTGAAFLVGGAAPLIPVALSLPFMQAYENACAAIVALLFGFVKARYTGQPGAIRSALFFLAIVSLGTLTGIVVGLLLHA